MICNKCHVHVEDGTTVCPVCGAAIEAEAVLEQEVPVTEVEDVTIIPSENSGEVENNFEISEDIPEEEYLAEDEEEAQPTPAKKKTWVKVTAIVACFALILGLAAMVWYGVNGSLKPRTNDVFCKDQYYAEKDKAVKAADTVIATVGDEELTNAQFQVFYWMGLYEFLQNYSNYLSYLGLDLTLPLSEQYVEEGGQTWEQYFLDGALNTWHSYQSLLLHAEKEGFTLPETLVKQIEAVALSMEASAGEYDFASADEMVQADMGPSADLNAYLHYMEIYYGGMAYIEELYSKMDPTSDEVIAYYEEHADEINETYSVDKESGKLIDVRHILVCPTGGTKDELGQTVYSEEEWEACRVKAEAYLKQWQDGEATEDSFAALATEVTEDPGSQGTGGLYTYVYKGQMVIPFDSWCFDETRQYGDTGLVKTNYGYHVMFFVYGEEGWIRRAKDALVTEMCTELMNQAEEEYPMEVAYKKIVLSKGDLAY